MKARIENSIFSTTEEDIITKHQWISAHQRLLLSNILKFDDNITLKSYWRTYES